MPSPTSTPRTAAIAAGFAPDSLALALLNATAMGLDDELEREASVRRSRIARAVADRLRAAEPSGSTPRWRPRRGPAAVLAALEAWAHDGAGTTSLERFFARASASAEALSASHAGTVRQLRVVVQASEFDEALAFYRDTLGMPQAEAYEAEGGARVVILDAGRATLELANPAQVAFIDRVETDGGRERPDPAGSRGRRHRSGGGAARRRGRRGRGIRSRDAVALAERAPSRAGRRAADAVPGARAAVVSTAAERGGRGIRSRRIGASWRLSAPSPTGSPRPSATSAPRASSRPRTSTARSARSGALCSTPTWRCPSSRSSPPRCASARSATRSTRR